MRSSVKPRDLVFQLLAIAIVILIAAGMIYEKAGQRRDRRRYPQIGRSVDIGRRTLNIYCSGVGGPTVIFETFGHMAGYSWKAVQAETAKFTRARDAALEIRVYRGAFPDHVAGIVMIDPNDVDNPNVDIPGSVKGGWAKHFGKLAPRLKSVACVAWRAIATTGLLRAANLVQGMRGTPSFGLNAEEQAELDFLSERPRA